MRLRDHEVSRKSEESDLGGFRFVCSTREMEGVLRSRHMFDRLELFVKLA